MLAFSRYRFASPDSRRRQHNSLSLLPTSPSAITADTAAVAGDKRTARRPSLVQYGNHWVGALRRARRNGEGEEDNKSDLKKKFSTGVTQIEIIDHFFLVCNLHKGRPGGPRLSKKKKNTVPKNRCTTFRNQFTRKWIANWTRKPLTRRRRRR